MERLQPPTKSHITNLEDELLVILMEECGEIIQAISKYLRHGRSCYNPNDENMVTNLDQLHIELGDLRACLVLLIETGVIHDDVIHTLAARKYTNLLHGKFPLYHRDQL